MLSLGGAQPADGDGSEDAGDFFLTPEELHGWVSGGTKGGGRDFVETLQRDVGATYLNTLNNQSIGPDSGSDTGTDPVFDPEILDSYEAAITFINDWDGGGTKKAQQNDWNSYGSDAHTELAAYNESGDAMVASTLTQIAMDGDDYSSALVQNYLAVENMLAA